MTRVVRGMGSSGVLGSPPGTGPARRGWPGGGSFGSAPGRPRASESWGPEVGHIWKNKRQVKLRACSFSHFRGGKECATGNVSSP